LRAAVTRGRIVDVCPPAPRGSTRVFDPSPDLIAVAGFDGYFKQVNRAGELILDYTVEELLSRRFLDFVRSFVGGRRSDPRSP
jgi:PAS domain-containing protein